MIEISTIGPLSAEEPTKIASAKSLRRPAVCESIRAIESPVLNRFRYVGSRDAFQTGKISNGACNLENAMVSAR